MSEAINTGGPAFPITDASVMHRVGMVAVEAISDPAERDKAYVAATGRFAQGMTLRDHFAGQAMQAMQAFLSGHIAKYGQENHWPYDSLAGEAYDMADAMIRARDGGAT